MPPSLVSRVLIDSHRIVRSGACRVMVDRCRPGRVADGIREQNRCRISECFLNRQWIFFVVTFVPRLRNLSYSSDTLARRIRQQASLNMLMMTERHMLSSRFVDVSMTTIGIPETIVLDSVVDSHRNGRRNIVVDENIAHRIVDFDWGNVASRTERRETRSKRPREWWKGHRWSLIHPRRESHQRWSRIDRKWKSSFIRIQKHTTVQQWTSIRIR